MNCLILTSPNSWFNQYLELLKVKLLKSLPAAEITVANEPPFSSTPFEFCLILSYEKILPEAFLSENKYNLVVHGSDLPKGKGMSPITWQILEGKNSIPLSLFEARKELDAGDIYLRSTLELSGYELVEEIRQKQAAATVELISLFFEKYPDIEGVSQKGEDTFYRRRKREDGELDINKSLKEQFNLLRISDNEKYPAFFKVNGHKYNLAITKEREGT
jgi:methionyl-tRNA formyltransferase